MILDIILGLILLIMTIRGIGRGIVREAMSFAGLTCALFLGAFFYPKVQVYLGSGHSWSAFVAFLAILIVAVIVGGLIELIFFRFLSQIKLSFIDYFLGLFIGLLEGCIVVMLILATLIAVPMPNFIHLDSLLNSSYIANFLLPYVDQAHRGWYGWLESRTAV